METLKANFKKGDIIGSEIYGIYYTIERFTESYERNVDYYYGYKGYVTTCGKFIPLTDEHLYFLTEKVNDPKFNLIQELLEKSDVDFVDIHNDKSSFMRKCITIRFKPNDKNYIHYIMYLDKDGGNLYFDHKYYVNTGKEAKDYNTRMAQEQKLNKIVGFDAFQWNYAK